MLKPQAAALDPRHRSGGTLTGWKVLLILLAFFGTVTAVDATMMYCALSTFSGQVEASPYEHGLAYEKDIAAARAQDERGWQVAAHVARSPRGDAVVEVRVLDREGKPVTGLAATAALDFTTDTKFDRRAKLGETAPGLYRGDAAVGPGLWDLDIQAKRGGALVYRSRSRISLR